jgi:hypothetical protein
MVSFCGPVMTMTVLAPLVTFQPEGRPAVAVLSGVA